jgi:hypothetical protein
MTRLFVSSLLFSLAAAIPAAGQNQPAPGQGHKTTPVIPPAGQSSTEPKPKAPVSKQEGPLLLLDDDMPLAMKKPANMADNSRCEVCHLNLVNEELARTHARAGIGCAKCHGASDAHIADESWASGGNGTPPDIMFPRGKINPGCLACHAKDKLDPGDHENFLAGKRAEKCCIECHGKHRVPNRKCTWK